MDEIVEQMDTSGLLQKGGEKIIRWGKGAYAFYYGKERRTKELELQGLDGDEVRLQLWNENYITYDEYEIPRLRNWERDHPRE